MDRKQVLLKIMVKCLEISLSPKSKNVEDRSVERRRQQHGEIIGPV